MIFTLLWINLMLLSLLYSMLRRRLMWWIMKSYYNVLRLPLAFLSLLLIGFARTYLIALIWWYWVTHALLGFLSNLASLRALFWALSSISYSKLIFLVYLLNTLPLASGHLYADDVQAYANGPPSQFLDITSSIASLAADLDSWMSSNRLSLNPSKTQLIWLGTRQQLLKLDFALLTTQFPQFTFLTSFRDLGVTLDNTLSFSAHISNLSRSSFYHLRRLRAVRCSVSMPVFKSMVHAFAYSRVDYCNSLIIGVPKSRLAPLQSVLNAAARLIARIPRFSHISTFMTENLHWLPLSARIHFKIIFLVYKAFLGLAPSYLCKLIMHPLSAISDHPLRSLDRNDLLVPRSRMSTSQQCVFASAGPLLWNCLPVKTRAQILSSSFSSNPRLLMSFLFPGAYCTGGRL